MYLISAIRLVCVLFKYVCLLKVRFVAEEAVDTGGLRREFWQLFVENVQEYCIGKEGMMTFAQNTAALQVGCYIYYVCVYSA